MSHLLICVDAGTTNTRVWLTQGETVLASAEAGVGVRDTARDRSPARLMTALCQLIGQVRQAGQEVDGTGTVSAVVAAGMITSSLGLTDVPHRPAPVGIDDLAAAIEPRQFPDICELPVLLVPGVRCGPKPCDLTNVASADIMRGEETLCFGLREIGAIPAPARVFNLGSHWKIIDLDRSGRIVSSLTSMAGELIHTTQTQTILASAVPPERPAAIDHRWLEAGAKQQRSAGLARALFTVRLLELSSEGTPEQRLSYLIGIYLGADLDALLRRSPPDDERPLAIIGHPPLVTALCYLLRLERAALPLITVEPAAVQQGLLAGLRRIAKAFFARESPPGANLPARPR